MAIIGGRDNTAKHSKNKKYSLFATGGYFLFGLMLLAAYPVHLFTQQQDSRMQALQKQIEQMKIQESEQNSDKLPSVLATLQEKSAVSTTETRPPFEVGVSPDTVAVKNKTVEVVEVPRISDGAPSKEYTASSQSGKTETNTSTPQRAVNNYPSNYYPTPTNNYTLANQNQTPLSNQPQLQTTVAANSGENQDGMVMIINKGIQARQLSAKSTQANQKSVTPNDSNESKDEMIVDASAKEEIRRCFPGMTKSECS